MFFFLVLLLGESAQHIPPFLRISNILERNLFWSETFFGLEVQRLLHIFHLFLTTRGVVWGRSGLLFWDSAVRSGVGKTRGWEAYGLGWMDGDDDSGGCGGRGREEWRLYSLYNT